MVKFKLNNKATILPVTIASMFIMLLVAYACIKMFVAQNIMATTDQIRVRTRYASEGFAQECFAKIASDIDKVNYDPNINMTKNTTLSRSGSIGITNLSGTISSILFQTYLKRDSYEDYFDKSYQMYPNIDVEATIKAYTDSPYHTFIGMLLRDILEWAWLRDAGISYYEHNTSEGSDVRDYCDNSFRILGDKNLYDYYMDLDTFYDVYANSDYYSDTLEFNKIDQDFSADTRKTHICFIDCTDDKDMNNSSFSGSNYYKLADGEYSDRRKEEIKNSEIDSSMLNSAKTAMENRYSSHSPTEIYMAAVLVKYDIRNSSQSYVIDSTAKSRGSGKFSSISCTTRLFFDIFTTKLYKNIGNTCIWKGTWSYNAETGVWSLSWNSGSNKDYLKREFITDSTKYINNIKYRIQKWEVIS